MSNVTEEDWYKIENEHILYPKYIKFYDKNVVDDKLFETIAKNVLFCQNILKTKKVKTMLGNKNVEPLNDIKYAESIIEDLIRNNIDVMHSIKLLLDDKKIDDVTKLKMYMNLLQYVYPKKTNVGVGNMDGSPLTVINEITYRDESIK